MANESGRWRFYVPDYRDHQLGAWLNIRHNQRFENAVSAPFLCVCCWFVNGEWGGRSHCILFICYFYLPLPSALPPGSECDTGNLIIQSWMWMRVGCEWYPRKNYQMTATLYKLVHNVYAARQGGMLLLYTIHIETGELLKWREYRPKCLSDYLDLATKSMLFDAVIIRRWKV